MSEEILKALMQLFAIIAKQDGGVEAGEREYVATFLTQQLNDETVQEYIDLFNKHAVEKKRKRSKLLGGPDGADDDSKLTSVTDSVKTLGLCKKINKTLTQKQKVVVLVRLYELVNADNKFTEQRMAIINTVADVFNIEHEEVLSVEKFVKEQDVDKLDGQNFLIINDVDVKCDKCKHILTEYLDGSVVILLIESADLYFLKYTGKQEILLNGLVVNNRRLYLFSPGSTVKMPQGKPVYYSDVVANFLTDKSAAKICYDVTNLEFKFKSGDIGLRNINLSENQGKLIGIMGASGAGKTTLLNVMSGIETPTTGEVTINGINLHTEKKKIKGLIGYIPQDDLLIEELTVFENLYYNAKLCFKNKSNEEITELVDKTLQNLGLHERKDLKVGSPLNKMISGGQRKRLNIALELIREPAILFVDEPTSGLSSRDSENVMDLLSELALKGKLIFVVIHQPSSDIYKMFDSMIILDTGGYQIYNGNPVEAISYFKKIDAQVNSETGSCPECGNVNPEHIFNIVEAKVVDEFGRYTERRKLPPQKWEEHFQANFNIEHGLTEYEEPPSSLAIPSKIKQFIIYTIRDFLSKVSNKQYIMLNLLEAPLLGFILSFIIRFIADPESSLYIFRENENIPPYIFMCIVVALFLGLTVSAEEIFKDRKILKREEFLNLSRSSYLTSKILILFSLSAIQAFLFVIVGNQILGVNGMMFEYWFTLFTTAAFANVLGLNISASFNSAVTIYILIPLLMIPQMILGGAMFSFDKLNRAIGSTDKVPQIAEVMAARWSYEALMVKQFRDNKFEKYFYDIEKRESQSDFKQIYYLPELTKIVNECLDDSSNRDSESFIDNLELLKNEICKEEIQPSKELINKLNKDDFNPMIAFMTKDYLIRLKTFYKNQFQEANNQKEARVSSFINYDAKKYKNLRNNYHNETISDIVKKVYERNKILRYNNQLIQNIDPIFRDPYPTNHLDFRTHFYAPRKHFAGKYYDTFWFNNIAIWVMSLILYITLYYNVLLKMVSFDISGLISFFKKRKD